MFKDLLQSADQLLVAEVRVRARPVGQGFHLSVAQSGFIRFHFVDAETFQTEHGDPEQTIVERIEICHLDASADWQDTPAGARAGALFHHDAKAPIIDEGLLEHLQVARLEQAQREFPARQYV